MLHCFICGRPIEATATVHCSCGRSEHLYDSIECCRGCAAFVQLRRRTAAENDQPRRSRTEAK